MKFSSKLYFRVVIYVRRVFYKIDQSFSLKYNGKLLRISNAK